MANDDLAKRFYEKGERIAAGVTVQRPAHDLYAAWHSFEELPRFIDDLKSVTRDGNALRWRVNGPGGREFTWTARIINERPDEFIAWRTDEDADGVQNAGSIWFHELPYSRGTEVRVVIEYLPPGGAAGNFLAGMSTSKPQVLLKRGLFRFRQLMESGEIATSTGQPVGDNSSREDRIGEEERKVDTNVRDIARTEGRP